MLLNEHSINWFLVIYCFTHKAMYLSQFSSEKLLFAVITVIYNDLQLAKMHAETAECSVLKGTHILHLQGSWMIEERGGGEGAVNSLSARGNGWLQGNHLLDTAGQLHIRTHKVGTICTKPLQTQARSNKSHHGERNWAHNPTPSWGAIGNCQLLGKGETVFWKSVGLGESTILQ